MPTWLIYVKLGLMVMEMLKEKEKGDGLTNHDIAVVAAEAEDMGVLSREDSEKIKELNMPNVAEILESAAALMGGVK